MISTDYVLDPGSRPAILRNQFSLLGDAVSAHHPGPRDRFLKLMITAYARGIVDAFAALCQDPVLAKVADPEPLKYENAREHVMTHFFRQAGAEDMRYAMDRPDELPQFPTMVAWLDSLRVLRH
jgi:hypothetical protein